MKFWGILGPFWGSYSWFCINGNNFKFNILYLEAFLVCSCIELYLVGKLFRLTWPCGTSVSMVWILCLWTSLSWREERLWTVSGEFSKLASSLLKIQLKFKYQLWQLAQLLILERKQLLTWETSLWWECINILLNVPTGSVLWKDLIQRWIKKSQTCKHVL